MLRRSRRYPRVPLFPTVAVRASTSDTETAVSRRPWSSSTNMISRSVEFVHSARGVFRYPDTRRARSLRPPEGLFLRAYEEWEEYTKQSVYPRNTITSRIASNLRPCRDALDADARTVSRTLNFDHATKQYLLHSPKECTKIHFYLFSPKTLFFLTPRGVRKRSFGKTKKCEPDLKYRPILRNQTVLNTTPNILCTNHSIVTSETRLPPTGLQVMIPHCQTRRQRIAG